MNNKNNEIKVGVATFFGLILFACLLYFAKGINLFGENINIVFEFENSGGISNGAPVVFNGVKRGSVINVVSANDKAYITATIDKYDDLYSDATAIISMLEITGGKKIEISAGSSTDKFNHISDTIKGVATVDLPTLITNISGVAGNLTSIVSKLDNIIANIDDVTSDTLVMNNLRSIVSNTEVAARDLSLLVSDNKRLINNTLRDISTLTKDLKTAITENKPELEKIITELSATMNKITPLIDKTDVTLASVDTLLTNINSIVFDIKSDNGGAISKLIYDKNFANKLDSLIFTADTLLKNIKQYGINTNVRLGTRP